MPTGAFPKHPGHHEFLGPDVNPLSRSLEVQPLYLCMILQHFPVPDIHIIFSTPTHMPCCHSEPQYLVTTCLVSTDPVLTHLFAELIVVPLLSRVLGLSMGWLNGPCACWDLLRVCPFSDPPTPISSETRVLGGTYDMAVLRKDVSQEAGGADRSSSNVLSVFMSIGRHAA